MSLVRIKPGTGWVKSGAKQLQASALDWLKKATRTHPDLDFSEAVYAGKKAKVLNVQCKKVSHHTFDVYPDNLLTGNGCIYCSGYRTHVADYVARARAVHGDRYSYEKVLSLREDFHQFGVNITVTCKVHGGFETDGWRHLQEKGGGCPKCARKALFLNKKEFAERASLAHCDPVSKKPLYDYSKSKYVDYYTELDVVCPEHGVFSVVPDYHIHGTQCPECSAQGSRLERDLRSRLKSIPGVTWQFNNRRVLPGTLEIDAYAPEFKLGVEANGLLWHSEYGRPDDASSYHMRKHRAAVQSGITLLQFWEHELLDKPDLITSMIRNRLGLSKRVYARDCDVVELDSAVSRDFLSRNHLQGAVGATVHLGLLHRKKNRLAAVMTFSPPRLDPNTEWELVRFCCHRSITVVGGASKLLSRFTKQYSPKSIVSYADQRYSSGNLYTVLGFSLLRVTKPDYFYVSSRGVRVSRYKARHSSLAKWLPAYNADETEHENMLANKFYRVYDCGRLVYVWGK